MIKVNLDKLQIGSDCCFIASTEMYQDDKGKTHTLDVSKLYGQITTEHSGWWNVTWYNPDQISPTVEGIGKSWWVQKFKLERY